MSTVANPEPTGSLTADLRALRSGETVVSAEVTLAGGTRRIAELYGTPAGSSGGFVYLRCRCSGEPLRLARSPDAPGHAQPGCIPRLRRLFRSVPSRISARGLPAHQGDPSKRAVRDSSRGPPPASTSTFPRGVSSSSPSTGPTPRITSSPPPAAGAARTSTSPLPSGAPTRKSAIGPPSVGPSPATSACFSMAPRPGRLFVANTGASFESGRVQIVLCKDAPGCGAAGACAQCLFQSWEFQSCPP